ncbi:hypothetical protein PGS49_16030 [Yersinia intermedia]|uniref:hypothetical protein n=1 Tax=Yersinia intermedia TaxID=631 RepID=UPI0022FE9AF1|nr:hypothetical protein [Yersinia intermedia]MDA5482155.1 hypothetical protein [Yersinia intermedia]
MSSVYVTNCTPKSKPIIRADMFRTVEQRPFDSWSEPDILFIFNAGHYGRITILNRMTGYGYRDTETGFCEWSSPHRFTHRDFWLASNGFDIRETINFNDEMLWDSIVRFIKLNANTVIGIDGEHHGR